MKWKKKNNEKNYKKINSWEWTRWKQNKNKKKMNKIKKWKNKTRITKANKQKIKYENEIIYQLSVTVHLSLYTCAVAVFES